MKFNFSNTNFTAKRKLIIIPIILIIVGAVVAIAFGVNSDLKFNSGTVISYSYTGDIDVESVQSTIDNQLGYSTNLRISTVKSSGSSVVITVSGKNVSDKVEALTEKLTEEYPDNFTDSVVSTNTVKAQADNQFYIRCMVGGICILLVLFIYTCICFRKIGGFSAGLASVITLVIDLAFVFIAYSICRLNLTNSFFTALMVVLVYSVLNTYTVFECIRENRKVLGKKVDVDVLANSSISQAAPKTINISLVVLVALIVVLIVSLIFGSSSLISFSIATIIGVLASTFTSIYILGPIWALFSGKKEKSK